MIRFLNVYYPTRIVLLVISEALIIMGSLLLATHAILGPDTFIALMYEYGAVKLGVVTLLMLILSHYFDLYEPHLLADRRESYFRILFVVGVVSLLVAAAITIYPSIGMASYILPLGFVLLSSCLLTWRRVYDWVLTRKTFRECVYILGGGEYAQSLVNTIEARPDLGIEICGWQGLFQKENDRRQSTETFLKSLLKSPGRVERILVAMEDRRSELPVESLVALRFRGVIVEDANSFLERITGKIRLAGLRPSSFLNTEGFHVKPYQQIIRRFVSGVVAAFLLLLFLPLFPFVAVGIKLTSKGPLFFKQTRVGLGGRHFYVYKFRSMRSDAEADGAKWATKNDPRVTRFGRFLRKTRIDEVPQLWCVLRGDMSLVGPRPERPEFVPWLAERLPFYDLRHVIRPGLTGWAQVRFRYGSTLEDSAEKLEYDLYYAKHMSLGLDVLIMFETIKIILLRRGAQ